MVEIYLKSTPSMDYDAVPVAEKARCLTEGQEDEIEQAKALFYFVRDQIKYNPYLPALPGQITFENHKASVTLKRGEGYCIQKAVLFAALARAVGIPARLRFADIRNYLAPKEIAEMTTDNVFNYHGYCELYLEGMWVKAAPTFDLKICQEHQIIPVDFDGKNDAVLHRYNLEGKLHIEYIHDYGCYDDLPWDEIYECMSSIIAGI